MQNWGYYLKIAIKGWKFIFPVAIIFMLIGYSYSMNFSETTYLANASMIVNSKKSDVTTGKAGETTYVNDVVLAQKMVDTCRVLILSDNVLEKVNLDLGTNIPTDTMKQWISVSSPTNTEVIKLSVKNTDPQLAAGIANAIVKLAPAEIKEKLEVGSVKVVDYAKVPTSPIKEGMLYIIASAGLLGLLVSYGLLCVIAYCKPKISNKKDVKDCLSLTWLGELPHQKSFKKTPGLIIDKKLDEVYTEEIKMFKERVKSNCEQAGHKTILVTSTRPGEGKSTISANLSLSLALDGKSVLLIDFDFSKRKINYLFDMKYSKTLKDIFEGGEYYREAISVEPVSGLNILGAPRVENGNYFASKSTQIEHLIKEVKKDYDFIIIDTPPALIQSDTVSLSKYVDEIVLVVKQEFEKVKNIVEVRDRFLDIGSNIMGVVVNDVHNTIGSSYYSKYSYYTSYYKKNNEKVTKF